MLRTNQTPNKKPKDKFSLVNSKKCISVYSSMMERWGSDENGDKD